MCKEIDDFVEHCWKLATVSTPDEFVDWEQNGPELFRSGLGDPLPVELEDRLPATLKPTLPELLECVVEIGMCDAYGATTDDSRIYLQKVISILRKHDVPIPKLDPFTESSFEEMHGWGNPIKQEVIALWRFSIDRS
ncbi:MAG: hypothetical protein KC777_18565 [Cyanobacteria bacterium HKST-UBA02]|nr:hypothetical protein [Cyanobacteria bacterium HKST-UBA02]